MSDPRPAAGRPVDPAEEERELRHLIRQAGPRPAVPASDLGEIKAAARREWQRLVGAEAARRRWARRLAWAAGLAVAAVGAWWWSARTVPQPLPAVVARVELARGDVRVGGDAIDGGGEPLGSGGELVAGSELVTAGAAAGSPGRLAIRLAGGPSVRLDHDSHVRLASHRRLELLAGALYVDSGVSPAAGGGIEIDTGLGVVRDIGTQFEVRLSDTGEALRIRVREGRVTLSAAGESHSAAAGEELTWQRDAPPVRGRVDSWSAEWEWVVAAAPPIEIEGRTLGEFLDWVCREAGWRLEFVDPALAESARDIRVHGAIEELTLEQALSVVLPGSRLSYRLEDGVLRVARGAGRLQNS